MTPNINLLPKAAQIQTFRTFTCTDSSSMPYYYYLLLHTSSMYFYFTFRTQEDNREGLEHCSMSWVKRWIYNVLSVLTRYYLCPRYLHNHIPVHKPAEVIIEGRDPAEVLKYTYETPDQDLPAGIGIKQLYQFASASTYGISKGNSSHVRAALDPAFTTATNRLA